jgi:hypothetical protein
MWERHAELKPTTVEGWSRSAEAESVECVRSKIHTLVDDLGKWGTETFGGVRKQIIFLKKDLADLRVLPARVWPSHREIKIGDQLVELYHQEEMMWRQRSQVDWLNHGDKNYKFFPSKG